MCDSLAYQLITSSNIPTSNTLAVALGANLPSVAGSPVETLRAVRPKLESLIKDWIRASRNDVLNLDQLSTGLRLRWSPLFESEPEGGPVNQPWYVNAAVIIDGPILKELSPNKELAISLLEKLLELEKQFGRDRKASSQRWGPRSLDLDLLAWGGLQVNENGLTLPHPRLIERSFVLAPLAAAISNCGQSLKKIPPQNDWPE